MLDSEDMVGKIVDEGDDPVDATKASSALEIVEGSSEEVFDSLVAAAAASSAVEVDEVEKGSWKSDDEVEEGS